MNIYDQFCSGIKIEYLGVRKSTMHDGIEFMHHGYDKDAETILIQVFKLENKLYDKTERGLVHTVYNLNPGLLDRHGNFYPCSMVLDFVEVKSIEQEERTFFSRNSEIKATATIILHAKDLTESREMRFTIKRSGGYLWLGGVVNFFNKYIEKGFDLNAIDTERIGNILIAGGYLSLTSLKEFKGISRGVISTLVESLVIQYFANSMTRVGKDNWFWTEVEMSDLPSDQYLFDLLLNAVELVYGHVSHNAEKGMLMFRSGRTESVYTASHERCLTEDASSLGLRIRIAMAMHKRYSAKKHYQSYLSTEFKKIQVGRHENE